MSRKYSDKTKHDVSTTPCAAAKPQLCPKKIFLCPRNGQRRTKFKLNRNLKLTFRQSLTPRCSLRPLNVAPVQRRRPPNEWGIPPTLCIHTVSILCCTVSIPYVELQGVN